MSCEDVDSTALTLILDLLFLVVHHGTGDPNKPRVKGYHSVVISMTVLMIVQVFCRCMCVNVLPFTYRLACITRSVSCRSEII